VKAFALAIVLIGSLARLHILTQFANRSPLAPLWPYNYICFFYFFLLWCVVLPFSPSNSCFWPGKCNSLIDRCWRSASHSRSVDRTAFSYISPYIHGILARFFKYNRILLSTSFDKILIRSLWVLSFVWQKRAIKHYCWVFIGSPNSDFF